MAKRAPAHYLGAESDVARTATVRGQEMKKEYDFRYGRRGALLKEAPGKTRITIRIDNDILRWFRRQVDTRGGGNYQTLINNALRRFAESAEQNLEERLRHVLREELLPYRVLRKQLKEGAIRRSDRDRAIAAEWSGREQKVFRRKRATSTRG
jgi:uncharacterized protein (DUF4415 family)